MASQPATICGATNGAEVCGPPWEKGCPIGDELAEMRAAEVKAGRILETDGNRDGVYSSGDMVTGHAYRAPVGEPWALCAIHGCGLAQSAHAETLAPYRSSPPPFDPLGGASRGVGRCTCLAGPGTNPGCPVHP